MILADNKSKGKNTVAKAYDLAKPLADELGYEIWDVVFEKEGPEWYLRIYIDKPDGIDINDCEAFSRPYNKMLDETDFVSQVDFFEVCSPGLNRTLRKKEHFEKYLGSSVNVRFIRAVDGEKELSGVLESFADNEITVSGRKINISDTTFVKLDDDISE